LGLVGIFLVSINDIFATTNIENIMSDYRLKGDTYAKFDHPYMAFLNYDKANYQQGKDEQYNKWNEYKSFLDSVDEAQRKIIPTKQGKNVVVKNTRN